MNEELTSTKVLASLKEPREAKRSALVLGGGGAKGYAHLGVAQVLVEAGLEPDLIVGTSMGAVIGSTVASGTDQEEMVKVLDRLDVNNILKIPRNMGGELERVLGRFLVREIRTWRRKGQQAENYPVKLERLFTFFKLMTGNSDIGNLPIDYAAVATDLNKGREFVIKSGKIYRAIAASAAIPGLIPPVEIDGQHFVDGGVVDVLPILPALVLGATSVLAVNVGNTLGQVPEWNPLSLLYRSDQIKSKELTEMKNTIARIKLGDNLFVLNLPLEEVDWLNFNNVKGPVSIGRKLTRENLSKIKFLF